MSIRAPEKSIEPPSRYHWTVEAFYRAIAAGVFDEPNRLELIRGDLLEKEPVNLPHANIIESLAESLRELFGGDYLVREEKPIHLGTDNEPVPDIQIAHGTRTRYQRQHPTPDDLCLVIEVTDTTVAQDTVE